MQTVWKYPITNNTDIRLPKGAKVLSVNFKRKDLYLWCLIDTEEREVEVRKFMTFKTNDDVPKNMNYRYIGSVGIVQEMLFFHTFEVIP